EEIPLEVRDSISSYVSLAAEKSSGSSSGRSKVGRQKPLLDINTCDSASLESLPGIGPVLSVRIIKYRNLLGGFAEVQQLKEVYGLPEETYDLVSGRIYADTAVIRKININTADYKKLIRMPYFEKYEVTAILKYRELKGRIGGMDVLIVNNLIAEEKADKIKPYLQFGE
ncbi:MAG: helix-hairpin-helix domain-containing protein, partial [Bacteroidia bacterium]|nr:helix-hairpin-helix domain-containing protein [Bacteroidia bacterium]